MHLWCNQEVSLDCAGALAMNHLGRNRGTTTYGEPLFAVDHPPLRIRALLGLTALIVFFSYGTYAGRYILARTEIWVGVTTVSTMIIYLFLYCTKTRRGDALIVFQEGVWFWLPAGSGTFYSWKEIRSIRLIKSRDQVGLYFRLVITANDLRRYWTKLSFRGILSGFYYVCRWGSPLYLEKPCESFSDVEELYAHMQSRLDDVRSS